MDCEFIKDSMNINQIVQNRKDIYTIEGDCIVPDIKPDILEIISTNGILNIYKKEMTDGKIRIDGSVNCFVDYKSENEIRSINHTIEFSQIIQLENVKSDMNDCCNISLKSINAKIINERKINIKANLECAMNVTKISKVEYISGATENVQRKEKSINTNSLFGMGTTKVSINEKQDANIGDNIAEVLSSKVTYKDIETKISYNKILVKSDVVIKSLYLTDDGRIVALKNVYPIMGFIEMEGVNEESIVIPSIENNNSIINLMNNSINLDIEVKIDVKVYEDKQINLIEDMYSLNGNLNFKKDNMKITKNMSVNYGKQSFSAQGENVGDGSIIDIDSKVIDLQTSIVNTHILAEAEIETKILFLSGGIQSKVVHNKTNFEINGLNIDSNSMINMKINISNENYNVMTGGNIELKMDLDYMIEICDVENLEIINEAKVEEGEDKNPYNMVVYFANKNESLWDISKKFKTTEEKIIEENNLKDQNVSAGTKLYIST